jgi:DNA-binding response OmpR family regulator
VTDEGIGIAPEHHEAVFGEFVQVDGSVARELGGTGLGLALVKSFTELMGGRVALQSRLGLGSRFEVVLPLRARVRPDGVPSALQRPLAGEYRVLIVEDDLSAYHTLSQYLSDAGYFPIRARRGEEALELARALRPTVVTLDLVLPGLDGWEVLKQLKQDERTRDIPVVIVSMTDNRELGLSLGVDDYFTKPVDRERLLRRLKERAPPARGLRLGRLLVIDDDPDVHDFLGEELRGHGFVTEHAYSGADGLDRAARSHPDAVVLDLHMPGLSGFEVAAALRARAETAQIPVIVLTVLDLNAQDRARLEDKIQALVHKDPQAPARLVAAIRDLEARQPREAARAG